MPPGFSGSGSNNASISNRSRGIVLIASTRPTSGLPERIRIVGPRNPAANADHCDRLPLGIFKSSDTLLRILQRKKCALERREG